MENLSIILIVLLLVVSFLYLKLLGKIKNSGIDIDAFVKLNKSTSHLKSNYKSIDFIHNVSVAAAKIRTDDFRSAHSNYGNYAIVYTYRDIITYLQGPYIAITNGRTLAEDEKWAIGFYPNIVDKGGKPSIDFLVTPSILNTKTGAFYEYFDSGVTKYNPKDDEDSYDFGNRHP
jgi:hypothetical protein